MSDQLIIKDKNSLEYKNILPITDLSSVIDEDGNTLDTIIQGVNHLFLSYTDNSKARTRLQVPDKLRRKGLWISYNYRGTTVVTEYYDNTDITDKCWKLNENWVIVKSTSLDEKFLQELQEALNSHIINTENPHNVTKDQIGLSNVDNTSDIDKPISTNTQEALDTKVDKEDNKSLVEDTEISKLEKYPEYNEVNTRINTVESEVESNTTAVTAHINNTSNPHEVTKAQIGLSNVTNDAQVKRTEMGASNGVATLDSTGTIPASQLPSYVDDVLEYDTVDDFPATGETGKIYVSINDNNTYRWSGTQYVLISKTIALGETSSTAFAGDRGKALSETVESHITNTDNPHNVTKEQLGLDKVDNTSDLDKPISTATQQALSEFKIKDTSYDGNSGLYVDSEGRLKIRLNNQKWFTSETIYENSNKTPIVLGLKISESAPFELEVCNRFRYYQGDRSITSTALNIVTEKGLYKIIEDLKSQFNAQISSNPAIVKLSPTEYYYLSTKDTNTLYVVIEPEFMDSTEEPNITIVEDGMDEDTCFFKVIEVQPAALPIIITPDYKSDTVEQLAPNKFKLTNKGYGPRNHNFNWYNQFISGTIVVTAQF